MLACSSLSREREGLRFNFGWFINEKFHPHPIPPPSRGREFIVERGSMEERIWRIIISLRVSYFIITLLISLTPALAQVTFTNDQAQFLARNPNLQFQDFLGKVLAMPEVCANPANSSSNDNCFSPGQILPDIEFVVDPGLSSNALVLFNGNFFGNNNPPNVLASNVGGVGDDFDIIFTEPNINAVGINAGCLSESNTCINGDTVRVSVFGGSGLLGTIEIPVTSAFDSFLGIKYCGADYGNKHTGRRRRYDSGAAERVVRGAGPQSYSHPLRMGDDRCGGGAHARRSIFRGQEEEKGCGLILVD